MVRIFIVILTAGWGCSAQNLRIGFPGSDDRQKQVDRQMARNAEEPQAAAKLPEMTDASYEVLGDEAVRQGNFQLAMMRYEKASAENPKNVTVPYKMGVLLLSRGMNEAAVGQFQELLKKQPDHALAYEGIGRARFVGKQYTEAATQFRRALQLNPSLWRSHALSGNYPGLSESPE